MVQGFLSVPSAAGSGPQPAQPQSIPPGTYVVPMGPFATSPSTPESIRTFGLRGHGAGAVRLAAVHLNGQPVVGAETAGGDVGAWQTTDQVACAYRFPDRLDAIVEVLGPAVVSVVVSGR